MNFQRHNLSDAELRDLYRKLVFPRLIEEKMLILLRQGKVSKWFSGIGQEAIAVGLTAALRAEDYLLPLHRNLGVFTTRGLDLTRLLCQWQGKAKGYTQGRDRSFHFASPSDRIVGMISHLGAMLPVADGLALAAQLDGEDHIAVAFSGDGGTSEGDFHEAINVAAVWDLPVIFLIENNGYGLSTPGREQFRARQLADRAIGYGIEGHTIDGNNVLEVYHKVKELAASLREHPRPVILEGMTFRMRGHEEASGTKYVPQELFEEWGEKDPISNYEAFLKAEGVLSEAEIQQIRQETKARINRHVEEAWSEPEIEVDEEKERRDIFAPAFTALVPPPIESQREIRFVDAISEGLRQAMQQHPELVIMGQDVAEYGGVFKITQGFLEEFGKGRVRNTPICESAIVGASLGLSLAGKKALMEMQFSDFASCGFNQIANNLAKTHYRWQHPVDVVIRMPSGGGVGAGPFHSQSIEGWFTHIPGLKVVYPSSPADAKGLLATAIADPNPVLFFEHKLLYRSESGPVPESYYHLPLGKARQVQAGSDLTIVTYGLGVRWAREVAGDDPEVEIIDLRSLIPWDQEAVFASVRKTGKCLVLYEATETSAFGAEVAAVISENCFEYLDSPVRRLGSLDTPVPFEPRLEATYLAKNRLAELLEELKGY
jgi:2-oxoisovalerate dehydrogenase E1 component